jgi:hypothetical protein
MVDAFGKCPRCKCTDSDVIKDYPQKAILKCWNCYLKYGQRKYPPYHYIRLRKRRPHSRSQIPRQQPIIRNEVIITSMPRTGNRKRNNSAKKAIISGAIIVSLLVVVFFSGALSNFGFQDFTLSPHSSPVASSNAITTPSPISSTTAPFSSPITSPNLLVNPKTMHYSYTLRGVSSEITFTVYEGMYDYLLSSDDSTVSYYAGQQPSPEEITRIVTLRYVNESVEQGELHNLVKAIEQITPNEDDQARIAISLVQNIPYDWNTLTTNSIDWKYPYEVLYSDMGVCSEKTRLLVCLLRDLGYGCSILDFTSANHQAVGIACPSQYAYYSGYAFVESTTPSIITDCYGDYVGAGKLPSSPSYVIVIQDGKVMNSVSEEYQDNQTYQSLINMGPVLDESHYTQWQTIVSKYGIQVT